MRNTHSTINVISALKPNFLIRPSVLVNGHIILDLPRPIDIDTMYMNELMMPDAAKHEEIADEFLRIVEDASKTGLIICSFGTTAEAKVMPLELVNLLAEAFSSPLLHDYNILWK